MDNFKGKKAVIEGGMARAKRNNIIFIIGIKNIYFRGVEVEYSGIYLGPTQVP
jgi:hypothetical protein